MIERIVAAFLREKLNLEANEESIGSKNPKADVIPANNMAKNNNGAKIRPERPIMLNIIGNTININPVPSVISWIIGVPALCDMNPKIENTPNDVKISNKEFNVTTINTLSVKREFLGKYSSRH